MRAIVKNALQYSCADYRFFKGRVSCVVLVRKGDDVVFYMYVSLIERNRVACIVNLYNELFGEDIPWGIDRDYIDHWTSKAMRTVSSVLPSFTIQNTITR